MTCIVLKISIIITLLRLAIERVHLWILYAAVSFASAVGLVFLFFTVFQCSPVEYFWNKGPRTERGTCIDMDILISVGYFYSAGAAVTDLTIAIIPVALIWNLHMNRLNKCVVMGVLCIGSMFVIPNSLTFYDCVGR